MCALLRKEGLTGSAYIAGSEKVLKAAVRAAPDISRACLAGQENPEKQLELALRHGCSRVQFRTGVTEETIAKAHMEGLICNLFYADEPEEARMFIERGIDVILTNHANRLIVAGIGEGEDIAEET